MVVCGAVLGLITGRRLLKIHYVFAVLLAMSLQTGAQQIGAQQPAAKPVQQVGGPNSGPAPAPPPLTGDALQRPGVRTGKLSEKLTLKSQVYDGMVSDY
jgi:hypothetical protein